MIRMSWDDYRRRRAAIKLVLEHATARPDDDLAYEGFAEVNSEFRSRNELVLALQYDWSQALWAQIELLTLDTSNGPQDANEVCRQAWQATTALRPTLRGDPSRNFQAFIGNWERERAQRCGSSGLS
jgi:hypothetical protein